MFEFVVQPDGGEPYELAATTRDILQWEKGGRGRSVKKLREEQSISDMYAIAHQAARRQGMFTGSLDDFEAGNDLDMSGGDDEDPDGEEGKAGSR